MLLEARKIRIIVIKKCNKYIEGERTTVENNHLLITVVHVNVMSMNVPFSGKLFIIGKYIRFYVVFCSLRQMVNVDQKYYSFSHILL